VNGRFDGAVCRRLVAALMVSAVACSSPAVVFASGDDDVEMPESTVPGSLPPAQPPVSPPPVSPPPVPSSPVSTAPSVPSSTVRPPQPDEGVVRRLKEEWRAARRAVKDSRLSEDAKKAFVARLDSFERRVNAGDVSVSAEVAAVVAAVRAAAATPPVSPPAGSSTSVPTGSSITAPSSSIPAGSSTSVPSRPRRDDSAAELLKKLVEVRDRVSRMPMSSERDALMVKVSALISTLEKGSAVSRADVAAVEAAVRTLAASTARPVASVSPGDDVDQLGEPSQGVPVDVSSTVPDAGRGESERRAEREEALNAQRRARLSGSATEALSQLASMSGPAVEAATAAFEALLASVDAGVFPSREQIQAARDLFDEATVDSPAVRAAVTLAGVAASVDVSRLSDDVRSSLLAELEAAKAALVADPSLNPAEVVAQAVASVRQARIAAAAERVAGLAAKVKAAAQTAGNVEAELLATRAESAAQAAVSREDVRAARDLVREAVSLLKSSTPTPSTVPDEVPSTTADAATSTSGA
jgi:hypothetical protein